MALLMMLSSTGFSMDIHYCQDQLKGVSLLVKLNPVTKSKNAPCHKMKKSCHHKNDNLNQTDKDNCCHNETVVIENQI